MERPSRWEKIKEIVGTALERDPAHRASYLDAQRVPRTPLFVLKSSRSSPPTIDPG